MVNIAKCRVHVEDLRKLDERFCSRLQFFGHFADLGWPCPGIRDYERANFRAGDEDLNGERQHGLLNDANLCKPGSGEERFDMFDTLQHAVVL